MFNDSNVRNLLSSFLTNGFLNGPSELRIDFCYLSTVKAPHFIVHPIVMVLNLFNVELLEELRLILGVLKPLTIRGKQQ